MEEKQSKWHFFIFFKICLQNRIWIRPQSWWNRCHYLGCCRCKGPRQWKKFIIIIRIRSFIQIPVGTLKIRNCWWGLYDPGFRCFWLISPNYRSAWTHSWEVKMNKWWRRRFKCQDSFWCTSSLFTFLVTWGASFGCFCWTLLRFLLAWRTNSRSACWTLFRFLVTRRTSWRLRTVGVPSFVCTNLVDELDVLCICDQHVLIISRPA